MRDVIPGPNTVYKNKKMIRYIILIPLRYGTHCLNSESLMTSASARSCLHRNQTTLLYILIDYQDQPFSYTNPYDSTTEEQKQLPNQEHEEDGRKHPRCAKASLSETTTTNDNPHFLINIFVSFNHLEKERDTRDSTKFGSMVLPKLTRSWPS